MVVDRENRREKRSSFNVGAHGPWACGYRGAEALRVRQENCKNPSAKVVVPRAAREARCSTMIEQHGDGQKPTTSLSRARGNTQLSRLYIFKFVRYTYHRAVGSATRCLSLPGVSLKIQSSRVTPV